MKNPGIIFYVILFSTLVFLPGCDVVGDIFEAGFWTAIIILVLVVVIIGYIIKKILD